MNINIKKFYKKNFMEEKTFEELDLLATKIKNTINYYTHNDKIAILGNKSFEAYSSILAALYSNKTFIPINPNSGIERIKYILDVANVDTIIVCSEAKKVAQKLDIKKIYLDNLVEKNIKNNTSTKYVYIMFTSGSTGKPKGVPISKQNLLSYLNFVINKFNITYKDKMSQTFNINFDLAMHDIFISFLTGASLYPLTKTDLMFPNKFINNKNITIWFSVPSVIINMDRLKLFKKENSSLRLSLFCGEALPTYIAKKWQTFAKNSEIYNLYGPTETTIAISYYKFKGDEKDSIVPIGIIFPNHTYKIIDEELLISGPQIFDGYLNSDKNPFITIDNNKYYKTGDIVKIENNILKYVNRKDFDIKFQGYRINLLEIENLIKEKFNILGVCVPKIKNKRVEKLIFFSEKELDPNKLKTFLPPYMIPDIIKIDKIKLTQNGKIDRKYYIQSNPIIKKGFKRKK